jgi:hypothetical protein
MASDRPFSFRRRWARAGADTHWLELRTDIVPSVLAGVATFIVTWGSVGVRPGEIGLPILASIVVVIVYFLLSNTAEFVWHFAVAGYKNQIEDLRSGGQSKTVVDGLAVLLAEAPLLCAACADEQHDPPLAGVNDWVERGDRYLQAHLGAGYVARFNSAAGLPMSANSIASVPHRNLWAQIHFREARLAQFIEELSR